MSILTMNECYTPREETTMHVIHNDKVVHSQVTTVRDSSGVYNYGLPTIPLFCVKDIKVNDVMIGIYETAVLGVPDSFIVFKIVCDRFYTAHNIDWVDYTIIMPSGRKFGARK